jgi:hypothetical protein
MWTVIAELAAAIIAAAALIIVAVIETGNKRRRKTEETRRERRERESRLSIELMSACTDLAYVTSLAVTGGHTNGNVEAAQEKARKAQEDYEDFLRDEIAHAVSKK